MYGRHFTLAGLILLVTICAVASWAVALPAMTGEPDTWPAEVPFRLLVVWECGVVPLVFLRWRRLRNGGAS